MEKKHYCLSEGWLWTLPGRERGHQSPRRPKTARPVQRDQRRIAWRSKATCLEIKDGLPFKGIKGKLLGDQREISWRSKATCLETKGGLPFKGIKGKLLGDQRQLACLNNCHHCLSRGVGPPRPCVSGRSCLIEGLFRVRDHLEYTPPVKELGETTQHTHLHPPPPRTVHPTITGIPVIKVTTKWWSRDWFPSRWGERGGKHVVSCRFEEDPGPRGGVAAPSKGH